MIKEIAMKNRSYRKFDESFAISRETLLDLADTARYSASSVNMQPMRYLLSCDRERNDQIFPLTNWARLLQNYNGPEPGSRPSAYIVVCIDRNIGPNVERFQVDVGIVSQTILLAAAEKGLGGCMIANFSKEKFQEALKLADNLYPAIILALGKPAEAIELEEIALGANTNYYRDENGLHHVPKIRLADIVF